jgi:DNA-binding NtrC family response regulator
MWVSRSWVWLRTQKLRQLGHVGRNPPRLVFQTFDCQTLIWRQPLIRVAKPVDAEDVAAALLARDNKKVQPPENPMRAARVRWEQNQRIYELCDRNISETARRLKMHRRTLQRILNKRAPK